MSAADNRTVYEYKPGSVAKQIGEMIRCALGFHVVHERDRYEREALVHQSNATYYKDILYKVAKAIGGDRCVAPEGDQRPVHERLPDVVAKLATERDAMPLELHKAKRRAAEAEINARELRNRLCLLTKESFTPTELDRWVRGSGDLPPENVEVEFVARGVWKRTERGARAVIQGRPTHWRVVGKEDG